MYEKINIYNAKAVAGIYEHLQMNNYSVERFENHLYVLEDELVDVETILTEHAIIYEVEGEELYKHFHGYGNAVLHGKINLKNKYDWEKVIVADQPTILCKTNLSYIDLFSKLADGLIDEFKFENSIEMEELRGAFIKAFEEKTGFILLDVSEYRI